MEQKLFTLPGHLSSPPVFIGVRVIRSLVLCVCLVDHCLSFCTFLFAIVLSVLRFADSDYPSCLVSSNSSYNTDFSQDLFNSSGHCKAKKNICVFMVTCQKNLLSVQGFV